MEESTEDQRNNRAKTFLRRYAQEYLKSDELFQAID